MKTFLLIQPVIQRWRKTNSLSSRWLVTGYSVLIEMEKALERIEWSISTIVSFERQIGKIVSCVFARKNLLWMSISMKVSSRLLLDLVNWLERRQNWMPRAVSIWFPLDEIEIRLLFSWLSFRSTEVLSRNSSWASRSILVHRREWKIAWNWIPCSSERQISRRTLATPTIDKVINNHSKSFSFEAKSLLFSSLSDGQSNVWSMNECHSSIHKSDLHRPPPRRFVFYLFNHQRDWQKKETNWIVKGEFDSATIRMSIKWLKNTLVEQEFFISDPLDWSSLSCRYERLNWFVWRMSDT